MFRSIQWKLVVMYLLLVLLAMQLISVYIVQTLQRNLQADFTEAKMTIGENLAAVISFQGDDREKLKTFGEMAKAEETFLLDQDGKVIDAAKADSPLIGKTFFRPEISLALKGTIGQDTLPGEDNRRYLFLAIPVKREREVRGVIYMKASLEDVYSTVDTTKRVLASATVLALAVTAFIGFLLSRTITGPIQEVTSQAEKLAAGDFSHRIEVKSNDEIGQLTDMFNYLTLRLNDTLGEIANEKAKMEAILTYMADGIVAVSMDKQIIHINPAARSMLGLQANEPYIGRTFTEVWAGQPFGQYLLEAIQQETEGHKVIVVGNKVLRTHFAYAKNEKGEAIGLVAVLQDITEQEKLETMRRDFVANVSHELRTPLTTIKSYVETLLDGVLDDRETAGQFLRVVDREADRMTRLVSDLLQLSQFDSNRAKLNKQPISLERLIRKSAEKVEVPAKQKGHSLSLNLQPGLPPVLADPDRIEQVFLNILTNAIKYTPDGGQIEISLRQVEQGLEVRVKDNGVGVPAEDLPRLFERFYRVDKARSREMGGTGLGLSIAKQIIDAHGGTIGIESEYKKGTEVYFVLPPAPPESMIPVA